MKPIIRIRYFKTSSGTMISKPLNCPNGTVVAEIEPDGTSLLQIGKTILNVNEVPCPLHKAKKLVKDALKELGVNFSDEVRPRLLTAADGLIKADFGPDASKTYKNNLFED